MNTHPERRLRQDLRASIQRYINQGYEVMREDSLRLYRIGCPVQYVVIGELIVERAA